MHFFASESMDDLRVYCAEHLTGTIREIMQLPPDAAVIAKPPRRGINRDDARMFLELLDLAHGEGLASEEAYAYGRKLRDEFFPDGSEWEFIWELPSVNQPSS